MRSFAVKVVGVALMLTLTGCCCGGAGLWPFCGGSSYGCGYGGCATGGCATGTCPSGACGVGVPGGAMAVPQGAFYNSYDTVQAGIPTSTAPVAAAPVHHHAGFIPQTASTESLPTY